MEPAYVRKDGRKVTAQCLAQKERGVSTATGRVSAPMELPAVQLRGNAPAPLGGMGRNVSFRARRAVLDLDVVRDVNVKMQTAVTQ